VANAVKTLEDLVPLLTCNNDIPRHRSSLGLMTNSGIDTEAELILERSSIFDFPSNISDRDIFPAHCFGGEGVWRVAAYQPSCRRQKVIQHQYVLYHDGKS